MDSTQELRKALNILFDDGRIAYANDKSPDVCQQYIDRAEAYVRKWAIAQAPEKDDRAYMDNHIFEDYAIGWNAAITAYQAKFKEPQS